MTKDYRIVPKAQKIDADFVADQNKDQLIDSVEDVQGDDFYVQAIERIANQGTDNVNWDLTVMQKNFSYLNMDQQWLSIN